MFCSHCGSKNVNDVGNTGELDGHLFVGEDVGISIECFDLIIVLECDDCEKITYMSDEQDNSI